MGMFDISDETIAEYTEKFRRGGAGSSFAIPKGGLGGIADAANALRHKKPAGALATDMFGLGGEY